MRALLLMALMAGASNAGPIFTNDTGFRWEIGEKFNPGLSASGQDGFGMLKEFRRASTSGPVVGRTETWGITSTRTFPRYRRHGLFTCNHWARVDPPLQWVQMNSLKESVLFAATDRWAFDIGDDPTIIGLARDELGHRGVGFVELENVGMIEIRGRMVADYQPARWGFITSVPEASTLSLLAVGGVIAWTGRRRSVCGP